MPTGAVLAGASVRPWMELADETPDAKIVKVNVDESPNLAAEYGVDSIPSLKVFKNGAVTGQFVGLACKSQLKSMLSR